jgi:hypothetical protein
MRTPSAGQRDHFAACGVSEREMEELGRRFVLAKA